MELPQIGQNCFVCNRNDYLPFKCDYCDKIICIDHKTNHGQDCPIDKTSFQRTHQVPSESLKQACDYCSKITLKLELTECQYCSNLLCLYHRHQVHHDCPHLTNLKEIHKIETDERKSKQRDALDLLRAYCSKKDSSSGQPNVAKETSEINPKKKELNRRVRVMKIKMNAKGPPNILAEERRYFEIKFVHEPGTSLSDQTLDGKTINIFTSEKHTLGRILDWSADELGLKNKNHVGGSDQLILQCRALASEEALELDPQASFVDCLSKKLFDEGDQLIMTYKKGKY